MPLKVVCLKCGHEWYTNSKRYSVACSRCKSQVRTGYKTGEIPKDILFLFKILKEGKARGG
jgi:DNA-directed RNA polymerase subunit RPC12/RpoP